VYPKLNSEMQEGQRRFLDTYLIVRIVEVDGGLYCYMLN
jgi:hypothetical protein